MLPTDYDIYPPSVTLLSRWNQAEGNRDGRGVVTRDASDRCGDAFAVRILGFRLGNVPMSSASPRN